MRIPHPLWRGFFLALTMTAALFLLGPTGSLDPYLLHRRPLAFALALAAGGVIVSIPRWVRRQTSWRRPSWQSCLRSFLCGAAMALGLGLTGDTGIIPALLTGSLGAYGFGVCALAAGFITLRIAERRRA